MAVTRKSPSRWKLGEVLISRESDGAADVVDTIALVITAAENNIVQRTVAGDRISYG